MIRYFYSIFLISFLFSCGSSKDTVSNSNNNNTMPDKSWRYFDREIYLSSGSSVSPEVGIAQLLIEESLKELETHTDLGIDYFSIKYEDESLLQPIANQTAGSGRAWKSFINIYEDDIFNEFLSSAIGESLDSDVISAINNKNPKEFFIMLRLNCFISSEKCDSPSQKQAKAFIFRAFGYILGLRYGESSYSAIMKPGISTQQEFDDEFRKFCNEFNNKLEDIRNSNISQ